MRFSLLFFALLVFGNLHAWEKYYNFHGNSESYKMIKVSDGYILAGFLSYGSSDVLLMKINNNGDTLWTKTYNLTYTPPPCNSSSNEIACDVIQTYDNNLLLLSA